LSFYLLHIEGSPVEQLRCHSLGFLPRSRVFWSDLGIWSFFTKDLAFF